MPVRKKAPDAFGVMLEVDPEKATEDMPDEEYGSEDEEDEYTAEFRMAAQEAMPDADESQIDALKRAIEACVEKRMA